MPEKQRASQGLPGLAPYGDAVNALVTKFMEGAGAFLGRICLPAAEEFGLLLRDRVSAWRARNLLKTLEIAEELYNDAGLTNQHAHPRIVFETLSQASWSDQDDMQKKWAGLLVSSCSEDGRDDANLLFARLLSQITAFQARVIDVACKECEKYDPVPGLALPVGTYCITTTRLKQMAGTADLHRIDRDLSHLALLGLLANPSPWNLKRIDSGTVDCTPTNMALSMYVRCRGSGQSPYAFFGLETTTDESG